MTEIIFAFLAGYIISMWITSGIAENLVKNEGPNTWVKGG